ncbi:MAG: response regulator [Limisphaerales bacterium]
MRSVLVIDDGKMIRTQLALTLKQAGWDVIEAEDGLEGIEKALEHKPSAVICDLLMPRCNGFQVCRKLREHSDALPGLKLIVLSGQAYDVDRFNALESGADEYMIKPVDVGRLLKLLETPHGADKAEAPPATVPSEPSRAEVSAEENFVRFWGVRGSIPTPGPNTVHYGGNTSCVELRLAGQLVILDAGSGLRELGDGLMREFPGKSLDLTLLLTHSHWDHIQGFPFFIPAYLPHNRLRIRGFEGACQGLESTFAMQMEATYFPVGLGQMPGNITFDEQDDLEFEIGPLKCRSTFTNHPGVTMTYRLEANGKSVVYAPDHESFTRMRLHSNNAPEDEGRAAEYAAAEDARLKDFIQGADVLITDSQYTEEEYSAKVGWGHSCFEDAVRLAIDSGVKRLYLFHHDPRRSDEDLSRIIGEARELVDAAGSSLMVEAAREGCQVELG